MAIINTAAAEALIRDAVVEEVFQNPIEESYFMRLARRLPTAAAGTETLKVVDSLPMTYWVNGETGKKQTTAMSWTKEKIKFEELAAIVPIPENVLEDADVDIIGEVIPRLREAIGAKVDAVTFMGKDRPDSFPLGIVQMARQAGNNVAPDATNGITYDKLLAVGGLFNKVEESGAYVSDVVASLSARAALRGIKDQQGMPIFKTDMQGATPYALDGAPVHFPRNGGFDPSIAQMIAGDFNLAVYAIRKDVDVRIFTEGVVQNPDGTIAYNLMQNDMIALRVTFRFGWAVPNAASPVNPDRILVPFSYIEPASAQTTYAATFTVYNAAHNLVNGAIVTVDGARLKTNASGVAAFNLPNGSYKYTAKLGGDKLGEGTFTVNGAAATITVGSAS